MATSMPVVDAEPQPGLSQMERLVNTFVAPSKTFTDIRRSSAWWLPFVIAVVIGYAFMFAVQTKVGWTQVVQNSIQASAKQTAQMEKLTPEQQSTQIRIRSKVTQGIFAGGPIAGLLYGAILTGLFMLTVNLAAGGTGTFGQYFAVWNYAALPLAIKSLLSVILLLVGGGGENFLLENPVGTNAAFYFAPGALPAWLNTLLTSLDVLTIWMLVLMAVGFSVVGKISRTAGIAVVFGWWGLWTVISVALSAAFA